LHIYFGFQGTGTNKTAVDICEL